MAAELFGVALEMRILAAENDMAGDEEVGLGKGRERRWWWKGVKPGVLKRRAGKFQSESPLPALQAYVSQLYFIGVISFGSGQSSDSYSGLPARIKPIPIPGPDSPLGSSANAMLQYTA